MLFQENYKLKTLNTVKKKLKFSKNKYYYKFSCDTIYMNHILELVLLIEHMIKKNPFRFPLFVNFGKTKFKDKLVLILFECIVYYININKLNVAYSIKVNDTIFSEVNGLSPLFTLNPSDFMKKFKFDLSQRHFRNIIYKSQNTSNTDLSILMQNLTCFFCNNGISEKTSSQLSEVFTELVGNASEHGNSDCLIDVDLTGKVYKKVGDDNNIYYSLNVAIINFSDILFHETLMQKMKENNNLSERYKKVAAAFKYHSSKFNEQYDENKFYIISSFQHKISGANKLSIGGTGLTPLIYSLKEKIEEQDCYMLSGDTALVFWEDLIDFDDDKFIGFNSSNNYFIDIPDNRVFINSPIYLPGTAFNLSFAIKKGWNEL